MSSHPRLRGLFAPAAGFLLLSLVFALRLGPSTSNAVYSSWPAVFRDVIGGPTVLIVIAFAAVVAGLPLVVMMDQRWPAHLRTRQGITRWVLAEVLGRCAVVFIVSTVSVLVWGTVLLAGVAPGAPGLVDPSGYGTADEVSAMVDGSYPLFALAGHSMPVFLLLSALWLGAHAGLVAVMSSLAALVVPRGVVALLLPGALLLAVSVGAELAGHPSASPFIMWMHPGGLLPSNLMVAAVPGAVLALLSTAAVVHVMLRAPRSGRFS